MFFDLLRGLGLTSGPGRAARPRPTRLNLEALERREVPAVVYAVGPNNVLVRFDSATPSVIDSKTPITGLGAGEAVQGIDFRPRTGQLALVTANPGSKDSPLRTYYVDANSGAATFVGASNFVISGGFVSSLNPASGFGTFVNESNFSLGASGQPSGFDVDPTTDRIHDVVPVANMNLQFQIAPSTGETRGTSLAGTPTVTGLAYDYNFDRFARPDTFAVFRDPGVSGLASTEYAIDRASNQLVRVNLDGTVNPVGFLNVALDPSSDAALDITPSTDNGGRGTAFAALTTTERITRFFSINLLTGAATPIGLVENGTRNLRDMAIVPNESLFVSAGAGVAPQVRSLDPTSGAVRSVVASPFPNFQGATKLAAGDVNRDGIPDPIVVAVAPQAPVRVFDGVTGASLASFFAFQGFGGTVNVGSGDVDGDGFDDVLVVANGANGHVKAFSGKDGSLLGSFLAYDGFKGNVAISSADFDNDGIAEIVTTAASNGHVKIFKADGTLFVPATRELFPTLVPPRSPGLPAPARPVQPALVNSFLTFGSYLGDVSVAAGDVTGDGIADVVVSSGAGAAVNVRTFGTATGALTASFLVPNFGAGYVGGATVALADVNADGRYDISVSPNAGTDARVLAFDGFGASLTSFPAFANYQGGASTAGKRF